MNNPQKSFFDRFDWQAFWCCLGVSLGVYLFSLGPSVGLEDAGELATAAQVLGVPHPPGYPLWTMLGWCFCRLLGWVSWQGYPNPAWAVALFSAISGAVATGVMALLAVRSGRHLLTLPEEEETPTVRWCAWLGGVMGSLCFAFSPVMWSQAVIVEVYALGALLMALLMALTYRWLCQPSGRVLVWLGFVFGLGLTNYQVLLLAAIPVALLIFLRNRQLAFSFLALGIPLGLTLYELMLGALPSADLFSTAGAPVILRPLEEVANGEVFRAAPGWFYSTLIGVLIGIIVLLWRKVQQVWVVASICVVLTLLACSSYCWQVRELPVGFAGTLYSFVKAWSVHLVALAGIWWLCWKESEGARRFAFAVTIVQIVILILLQQGLLLGLEHPTTGWFWWGIAWNFILIATAWRWLPYGRQVAATLLAAELGLSIYLYMPLVSEWLNPAMNWGYPCTWEGFKHAISRGQYEAIVPSTFFSKQYLAQLWSYCEDLRLQFSWPVVLLAGVGSGILVGRAWRQRKMISLQWLLCTLLFFFVMSALLVALANPSGDLQDSFIQKVKFISSHGVFALWVAYGLMAGISALVKRCPRRGLWAGAVVACMVALLPVIENGANEELIHRMGAAEQSGHDFGWQFGAYMLEGAHAILPELSEDEEPLPDPFYPPPMAEHAVLFGGTDPGRFVPTYMVYGVGMRPDVYVLTQNALADPTYMNVERDLYGDELWLPTADQVRDAFVDYVDEVQAGKRTTRGKIEEENGRMRISGSSAVMEINAILAQSIFDRNTNPFYLEESYTMDWMLPYLEPTGLIMRLQRSSSFEWGTMTQRDLDFWDWMTRRLTSRSAYRRDFAAKKSFSKLRSSLAGLYAYRQDTRATESAFYDALRLYPASSESVFRLIQEYYLPYGHFDEALRLLRRYQIGDPKNVKLKRIEARILVLKETFECFNALSVKVEQGTITTAERCELAQVCEALGLKAQAIEYWTSVVEAVDLTAHDASEGAIALQRLRAFETALVLLKRTPESAWMNFSETELLASAGMAQSYGEDALAFSLFRVALAKAPNSGRVWLGIALYYYGIGDEAKAYDCICTAVRKGASSLIREDAAVADVFLRLMQRYGTLKGGM